MTEITRRDFLRLAISAAALPKFLAACAKAGDDNVVNFVNWSAYIAKDTLPNFSRRTGIKVNYDVFADEEEFSAKLSSHALGYDLIVGADYKIPIFKAKGLIDPYPPGAIKNLGNVDSKFRDPVFDPGLASSVPYLWGTTGIGYNRKLVSPAPASWKDLWDPKHKGRLSMLDSARDTVSIALLMLGHPETGEPKALAAARDLLRRQAPLVKFYHNSTYMDALISGEIALAMAWSGDVLQAARENPDLDYMLPKEGSFIWVDSLCLVKGSKHRRQALALVDYILEPQVGAGIANFVRYASPNAAAKAHLDAALLTDSRVYPPPAVASRLKFHAVLDARTTQAWNQAWQDVKVS